jgi:hypothetical protein
VFTGSAAVYDDYASEWRFWTEPAGIASLISVVVSALSISAAWSCLTWKGEIGQGLDREGQGVVTRSMTVSGLTIIGVIFAWLLRGVF